MEHQAETGYNSGNNSPEVCESFFFKVQKQNKSAQDEGKSMYRGHCPFKDMGIQPGHYGDKEYCKKRNTFLHYLRYK